MPRTSKYDVKFAEMKKDIEYIKKAVDDNKERYEYLIEQIENFMSEMKERIDTKTDKADFNELKKDYSTFKFKLMLGIISTLLAILGYVVKLLINAIR